MSRHLPALIEPIRLRIDPENPCQAAQCKLPATAVLIYLSSGWRTVELRPVCSGHAVTLRAAGGCVALPIRAVPPMETILAVVNAEIAKRRQPQPTMQFVFSGYTTGTASGFMWNTG